MLIRKKLQQQLKLNHPATAKASFRRLSEIYVENCGKEMSLECCLLVLINYHLKVEDLKSLTVR